MEEEVITPEEETFDYEKLRYILDKDGYVCHTSFGGLIVCDLGECTEYKGDIPDGYESLDEWVDNANIRAYRILDGNLVFDKQRDNELQAICKQEEYENRLVTNRDLIVTTEIVKSQYVKINKNDRLIKVDNAKSIPPELKFTNIDPYTFNSLNLFVNGLNLLPNEATTQTINGIEFTQNEDRSITIKGTSTGEVEYTLAGANTIISPILVLKKGLNYYLNSGGYNVKMYHFNGVEKAIIYDGNGGVITFTDETKEVTHITLNIKSGVTIEDITIYPQLEYGTTPSDYETYKRPNKYKIDFSEYVSGEKLFASDTTYASDSLYPAGVVIGYIRVDEEGNTTALINNEEVSLNNVNINLFDGNISVYTQEDTNINMNYYSNVMVGNFMGNMYSENGTQLINGYGVLSNLQSQSHGNYQSYKWLGFLAYPGESGWVYQYEDLNLEVDIPDNFHIVSAILKIYHTPINWWDSNNAEHEGYSRNLNVYRVHDDINYSYNMGYYSDQYETPPNNSEIDFVTEIGTPQNTSGHEIELLKEVDIKQCLFQGSNKIIIRTGNALPTNTTSNSSACQQTGMGRAVINVLGYKTIPVEEEE